MGTRAMSSHRLKQAASAMSSYYADRGVQLSTDQERLLEDAIDHALLTEHTRPVESTLRLL